MLQLVIHWERAAGHDELDFLPACCLLRDFLPWLNAGVFPITCEHHRCAVVRRWHLQMLDAQSLNRSIHNQRKGGLHTHVLIAQLTPHSKRIAPP